MTPGNSRGKPRQRRRRRSSFCRLEHWILGVVALLGLIIIRVNVFILLQQPQDPPNGHSNKASVQQVVVQSNSAASVGAQENNNNINNNKEPLLDVLRMAKLDATPELVARLPTWNQVTKLFGTEPRMIGLDSCSDYRNNVLLERRRMAPAGIFNTGTNLLHQVLSESCWTTETIFHHRRKKQGVDWQVNCGKHQHARFRFNNTVHANIPNADVLPIVMTRDPWSWMQSMCRVRYSAHWFHVVPHPTNPAMPFHCPNMIPNHVDFEWLGKPKDFVKRYYDGDVWKVDNVQDRANFTQASQVVPVWVRYKSGYINHNSLAHMWKDWYQEYYDADFPRVMIRLEDLVFRPKQVVKILCDCIGGTTIPENRMTFVAESAKGGAGGEHIHGKNQTNLAEAMIKHVRTNKTNGMTILDTTYAKQVFDESIMSQLGYRHPI